MVSSTWTAVAGSLTAGDSARMPMSASSRNANSGSWRKVRSGPVSSPARTAVLAASPPCRSATGAPCWGVSPMQARSTMTAPLAARTAGPGRVAARSPGGAATDRPVPRRRRASGAGLGCRAGGTGRR